MKYENIIKNAISFLISSQNTDGGIASECLGFGNSGCWTTAEVLEAFMQTDFYSLNLRNIAVILEMTNFLLDNYIPISDSMGYWSSENESPTMTTGHVIYALNLVANKFLSNKTTNTINNIRIRNKFIKIETLEKKIIDYNRNAFSWILFIRNNDNGWGVENNQESSAISCYYVLKAFQANGLNAANNDIVNLACVYIENNLKKLIIKKNKIGNEEFAQILYSYITLHDCGYILKYNSKIKSSILSIIHKKWKIIYKSLEYNMNRTNYGFTNNLPWLVLNVLLRTEGYKFNRQLDKLIKYLSSSQELDGSWIIYKGQIKCNTWITAEILNDFNLVQERYQNYLVHVLTKKKYRKLIITNALLLIVCLTFIITYFASNYYFENSSLINETWAFIVAVLGLVSSIFTILDYFFQKH